MLSLMRKSALVVLRLQRARSGQPLRAFADGDQSPKPGAELRLVFASVNAVFYADVAVKQVDIPSMDGDFGVLFQHIPTLSVLRPGIVRVHEVGGKVKEVFVSSGSVTVNGDSSMQVVAEEAHELAALDATNARTALEQAKQQQTQAKGDLERAEADVAVEVATLIVEAVSART